MTSAFSPTLRALCAEATKGPWRAHVEIESYGPTHIVGKWHDGEGDNTLALLTNARTPDDEHDTAQQTANASLIVFLANRAEAIAELAEAAGSVSRSFAHMDAADGSPMQRLRAALAKLNETGEPV